MDILKAEMARKRKQLEDAKLVDEKKKFFKRGELQAKQEEEYYRRMNMYEKDKQDQENKNTEPTPGTSKTSPEQEKEKKMLPREEVIRRLREREEPVRLFGETDYDAYQRLRRIEILEPEVNKGFRNDLKAAMDKVDEQYLKEMVESRHEGEDGPTRGKYDLRVSDDGTTLDDIKEMAATVSKISDDKERRGNESLMILKFLKFLMDQWAKELNARPEEVKRSVQGKLMTATHAQTGEYLRPLFNKLKKKSVPSDIQFALLEIVSNLLEREYVKANDAYLRMAIGNAPWPIGVTMVGIHARTGREKIFAQNVAHVLNDETQRKYIQALKRLMTLCQQHFPADPSKCVEYNSRPTLLVGQ
ncbi:pre-mRNA-splicing factor 18-like [Branchiostoma floridae x Branchiostoma belcheri]